MNTEVIEPEVVPEQGDIIDDFIHLCTPCCPHQSLCGKKMGIATGWIEAEEAVKEADCVVCAEIASTSDNCPVCGETLSIDND